MRTPSLYQKVMLYREDHAISGKSWNITVSLTEVFSVRNPDIQYSWLSVFCGTDDRPLKLMTWCWGQKVVYIWIVLKLIDIIFSNIPVKYIKIAHNTKTIAAFYISGTFCPRHHDIVNFGKVMLYPEGHAIPRRSCYIRKVMLYPEGDKVWSISSPSGYILQKAFFRHVPAYLK